MSRYMDIQENRIRTVYRGRDESAKFQLYHWSNRDSLFSDYRKRDVLAGLLASNGMQDLSDVTVLDVGCGVGGLIRLLLEWGANDSLLHGVDLLEDRIERAKRLLPNVDLRVGSGWRLPFDDESMHLVSACTVLSSVVDDRARHKLAGEMWRVTELLGYVLLYDFRISHPRNHDTCAITKRDICQLFPNAEIVFRRTLTLAPPLSRRIRSPLFMYGLEALFPFLRTHAYYLLRKV